MNRQAVTRSGTALAAALVAALAAQSSQSKSAESGGTPSNPSGRMKTIHCNSLHPFASTLGQTSKLATAITLKREGLGRRGTARAAKSNHKSKPA